MFKERIEIVKQDIIYNVMKKKLNKIMKQEANKGNLYCSFYFPDDENYINIFLNRLKPEIEREYTVQYMKTHMTEEFQIYKVYRVLWCTPKKEI